MTHDIASIAATAIAAIEAIERTALAAIAALAAQPQEPQTQEPELQPQPEPQPEPQPQKLEPGWQADAQAVCEVVAALRELEEETENYTPIYRVQEQTQLPLAAVHKALYWLQANDRVSLGFCQHLEVYTPEQQATGVELDSDIGGTLFFVTID